MVTGTLKTIEAESITFRTKKSEPHFITEM